MPRGGRPARWSVQRALAVRRVRMALGSLRGGVGSAAQLHIEDSSLKRLDRIQSGAMNSRTIMVRWCSTLSTIAVAAIIGVSALSSLAAQDQAPAPAAADPGDIAEGLRLYQSKA